MFAILFVLSMLLTDLVVVQNSDGCQARNHSYCGPDCTGTPSCNGKTCGNVDNMCYCDCTKVFKEQIFAKHQNWATSGMVESNLRMVRMHSMVPRVMAKHINARQSQLF